MTWTDWSRSACRRRSCIRLTTRRGDARAGSPRARLPLGGARRLDPGVGDDGWRSPCTVIASGSAIDGVLLPPRGVRHRARLLGDAVVGVVSDGAGPDRGARRALQRRATSPTPSPRPARPSSAPRSTCCSARVEVVFVADGVDRVPVRLGTDDAGDGGARRDRTRGAREPARRVSLPGHVARRHRLPRGRLPDPGGGVRLAVVPGDAGRPRRVGADARRAVRAVLPRVRREGGHHPAARVAARSASGGAEQHLRAHVGGAHHGGHLRALQGLRVRPRRARRELGPRVHGRRHAVGHSGRAVRADADRHEAAARVQHDRERRHHRARAGRRR